MDILTYPLAFLVLLGVLVTFHEFGHYVVARLSGVQILRFSVGFGRPLWMRTDTRGTEFAVAAIPIGGYVRMLDDRDPEQRELLRPGSKAYMDLHPKWRIAIALGGPFANLLLAALLYAVLQLAGSLEPIPMTQPPTADSPAAAAGLTRPAQIVAVDGLKTPVWEDVQLALTHRLGETGDIALDVVPAGDTQQQRLLIGIERWHSGVGDPDVVRSLGLIPSVLPVVGEVVPDTPAAAAGLQAGDLVMQVDGEALTTWTEFVAAIEKSADQRLRLLVRRNGIAMEILATPAARESSDPAAPKTGFLGIGPAVHLVSSSWGQALPDGVVEAWDKTVFILAILRKMVTGDVSVKNLSGPISIAQVAGDSAKFGWRQFVGIMALLSISLGIMNLLPIPVLDGGHVVIAGWEWLRGKPMPEQVQIWGVQIGLVLVGCMLIFATYNDVLRFVDRLFG